MMDDSDKQDKSLLNTFLQSPVHQGRYSRRKAATLWTVQLPDYRNEERKAWLVPWLKKLGPNLRTKLWLKFDTNQK